MKNKDLREATFAGGCFWCMEPPFENLKGVKSVISGYTGGNTINPAYEEVSSGKTGHYEAVRVIYDPDEVSYGELLNVFWKNIDPTDEIGQFADRGTQYRTAVFYHSRKEKELAEASKDELASSGKFDKPIKTEILEAKEFYPAEDYHQDYYRTNPARYNLYKKGSGRSSFLEDKWEDEENMGIDDRLKNFKKPPDKELKELLTPEQYRVTREEGTELACSGGLTENKGEGIYVDIVSGEPLFSSKDKFDSGTGWPSFTRPLEPDNIVTKEDKSLFRERTEVRSRYADSHLGHVFKDGPGPDGLRYCINSAALRFIPKEKLKEEGYGKYSELFKDKK